VADMGRIRMLLMDGIIQGGVLRPEGRNLYPYAGYIEALSLAAVPDAKRILVIGLGAGVIPTSFHRQGLDVESVEINPQMTALARDYFDLPSPPMKVYHDDGRRFIRRCAPETYDVIIQDAYNGEEIPQHLLTHEAFQEVRRALRPGGALILNYVSYPEKPKTRMVATIKKVLEKTYPKVDIFAAGVPGKLNNLILVAMTQERAYSTVKPVYTSIDETSTLEEILKTRLETAEPYNLELNDDHAPLDWLDRRVRYAWRREMIEHFGEVLKGI
jgi:spermidine synthase